MVLRPTTLAVGRFHRPLLALQVAYLLRLNRCTVCHSSKACMRMRKGRGISFQMDTTQPSTLSMETVISIIPNSSRHNTLYLRLKMGGRLGIQVLLQHKVFCMSRMEHRWFTMIMSGIYS